MFVLSLFPYVENRKLLGNYTKYWDTTVNAIQVSTRKRPFYDEYLCMTLNFELKISNSLLFVGEASLKVQKDSINRNESSDKSFSTV